MDSDVGKMSDFDNIWILSHLYTTLVFSQLVITVHVCNVLFHKSQTIY